MRKKHLHAACPCESCMFRYDCWMSPLRRNHFNDPSSAHIVLFPELLTEASLPALFPELFFYP
jgi:hypothetical protein